MILTCPACNTSYSVKDGAIPPQGRTVRCASCKHSWHQPGVEPIDEPVVDPLAEPTIAPTSNDAPGFVAPEHDGEAAVDAGPLDDEAIEPNTPAYASLAGIRRPGVSAPTKLDEGQRATPPLPAADSVGAAGIEQPAVIEQAAPVADDSDWNDAPYADDEERPRRKGPLIMLVVLLLVAAIAAAAYFLAPRQWMARAGLADASGSSPLKLMVTSQTRQKLASGNDLVSLSGRVINPTEASEPVPALQADLRDGGGKLVYSWMIPPPAVRLAPRASASFNAAELGVPSSATSLTLRWAS